VIATTLVLVSALAAGNLPRKHDKDGWALTRDGRRIGKDCNPCLQRPAPGYKAPPLLPGEAKSMAGPCSPRGIDGKSKPPASCFAKPKEKPHVHVTDQH
jgi:hypothetical protein